MIADLVKSYLFEKLDKQIAVKIPYCLFIAIIVYFASGLPYIDSAKYLPYPFIIVGSFAFFLLTSIIFNWQVGRVISGNMLGGLDMAQTVKKLRSIYDGKNSLLDDFDASKNPVMIVSGFISGSLLCVFFVSVFLALLYHYPEDQVDPIAGVGALFLILYLYYDIGKSPLKDEEAGPRNEFFADLFQIYAVKNSLRKLRHGSEAALYFVSRLLGPLTNLQMPKFACRTILVYQNPALDRLIQGLSQELDGLSGRHSGGMSVPKMLTEKGEKITLLAERSQSENFPYLLDPEYKYPTKDDRRVWSAMSMVYSGEGKEKIACHVFIHKFRAFFVKRYVRNVGRAQEVKADPRDAYLFILIGDRSRVEYLLTKIELVSPKVPSEILSYELEA
jgi:hypothetical protein